MNAFVNQLQTEDTKTVNGALSNSSSQSKCLNYFFTCGNNRGRPEEMVFADMSSIFAEDPETAAMLVAYNRMISRKDSISGVMHKGQGQRDEFIKSMKYLEEIHPDIFNKILILIPEIGRWDDMWYDSPVTGYYHYMNVESVATLIEISLTSPKHSALIAKYLPKIRSKSNTKNDRHRRRNAFAKALCKQLGWSQQTYRKFKSNPTNTAHAFQRTMCEGKFDELEFNTIPGKALFNMITRTGKDGFNALGRHKQDVRYMDWVKAQPVAKFTGYPYELYKAARLGSGNMLTRFTLDKQFDGLMELAKSDGTEGLNGNVWCALDTSGSMGCEVSKGITAMDVCLGLGLYFSSLNEGAFKDHVIMFDDESYEVKLEGTLCEKVEQLQKLPTAWGSTNFQSVINRIVQIRETHPEIPIEDYPTTLLVVSDMQFNPTGGNTETNYKRAVAKLNAVGLEDMKFIWWNVNSLYGSDVPSTKDDGGVTLISGMDGTIVSTILGGEQTKVVDGEVIQLTPMDQMKKALDQPLLNRLSGNPPIRTYKR